MGEHGEGNNGWQGIGYSDHLKRGVGQIDNGSICLSQIKSLSNTKKNKQVDEKELLNYALSRLREGTDIRLHIWKVKGSSMSLLFLPRF